MVAIIDFILKSRQKELEEDDKISFHFAEKHSIQLVWTYDIL